MRVLPLIWLLLAVPATAQEPVKVWEDTLVIPTYPLGPDDVNPHFFELEGSVIYPYTMQDSFTTERVDRTYRGWYLENEYIQLVALPEIGGRIQYVTDKRRGEPMFYANRVIRPGHIALRGAWVSGGIEWNRGPTGHTVTSFSPVNVVGVENPDGSASLVIGTTEMNFRTGWEVRLTLHPGRTYLDEEITLFNPTDGFHPYYFWNNTAFPNRPGTRFMYPMTLGSDHDGTSFFSWPIHDGVDLTWLKHYPEPTSVFAYRSVFDFFGAYDVDRDYGIVQVANHHVLPGKKAWTWGEAESGLVSQSVLTDDDGPYIEVQSGPLLTQADFAMLAPGQEVTWREYWYPIFDLVDGFEYATQDVAVQRVETDGGVELRIHASGTFDRARVRVDDRETTVSLSPRETVVLKAPSKPFSVSIHHGGRELLAYDAPLAIPIETAPTLPDDTLQASTASEARLIGADFDVRMERVEARSWYERALAMDPSDPDSLVALAVLDLEAGLDESAAGRLARAIERDPSPGMTNYLAGVAALRTGRLDQALGYGYAASKRHGTRALGLGLSGRALMRLDRVADALEAFRAAYVPGGQDHQRLFDELLIATLASGIERDGVEMARGAVERGTVRIVPWAILVLAGDEEASTLLALAGEDEFAVIEASLAFARLGRTEEASRLLELANLNERPLPHYFLAYWGAPEDAAAHVARATSFSHDYVFPSRPETLAVLEHAIENGGNGATHLILGNLLAGLGRMDEAVDAWMAAVERGGSTSVALRNLAMVSWKRDHDLDAAAARFERAIAGRATDQTLHRDLGRVRLEQERPAEAIELLTHMEVEGRRRAPRADVTLLLARSYVEAARYDAAITLLAETSFTNREGDSGTWSLFSRAHIERGRAALSEGRAEAALRDFETALTYPRNLNVGRPAKPIEARALLWKGAALDELAREAEARRAWTACAESLPLSAEQIDAIAACRERQRAH